VAFSYPVRLNPDERGQVIVIARLNLPVCVDSQFVDGHRPSPFPIARLGPFTPEWGRKALAKSVPLFLRSSQGSRVILSHVGWQTRELSHLMNALAKVLVSVGVPGVAVFFEFLPIRVQRLVDLIDGLDQLLQVRRTAKSRAPS
jgi:hypothetical protein